MFDLVDGIKAKGSGKITLKHFIRIALVLILSVLSSALIRYFLGKSEIIPLTSEFIGVMIGVFLVFFVDYLRELIKNGKR